MILEYEMKRYNAYT